MPWLGLEVYLSAPDAETFAAAARDWLSELPGLLSPDEWEEVLRNDKPPFTGKPEMLWPSYDEWVEPFMAWGRLWARRWSGTGCVSGSGG